MAQYIDPRSYHVPARYQQYFEMNPSTLLAEMRAKLIDSYKTIAEGSGGFGAGSAAEAKVLQDFLQQIKQMTSKNSDTAEGRFETSLMQEVIQKAAKLSGQGWHSNRQWFKMLTGKNQGIDFERELASIVAAAANMTGGDFESADQLMTGTETANVGGMGQKDMTVMLKQFTKGVMKNTDKKLAKLGSGMSSKTNSLVTVAKQAKTDVTALTMDYTFIATGSAEFDKAARLLQNATFTAKSYQSVIYDTKTELEKNMRDSHLTLGDTNTNRIVLDMIMKYGSVPYPVAASFLYRTLNSLKNDAQATKQELSRLRWIYELTGYGQTYMTGKLQQILEKQSSMGAKYLVFNDPKTNDIFVRSTADLVKDVMADFVKTSIGRTSVIQKSLFY